MTDSIQRRDQRILVTGAHGFIGRVLRARLVDQGIVYTDRDTLDVSRRAGLADRLRGFDTVVHLATTLRGPGLDAARATASLRMARNVVHASVEACVRRLVLMSSVRWAPLPEEWRGRGAELGWPLLAARVNQAIERLGQGAAELGLDVITLQPGAVSWPDRPHRGLEAGVWLSHEDCADLFRRCIDAPLTPGRCVRFVAVSDTPQRRHDTANPIGWVSRTHAVGLRRRLHYRKVQFKTFLKPLLERAFERPA